MSATHTPTPWKAVGDVIVTADAKNFGDHMETTVARALRYGATRPTEANIEFIVRACNAYDGMLAALRAFVQTVENTGGVTEQEDDQTGGPVADPEWLDLGDAFRLAAKMIVDVDGKLPEKQETI